MYDLAVTLLSPLPLLLLTMAGSLVYLWRVRKLRGRALVCVATPLVGLVVLSMPATGNVLVATLEGHYTAPEVWPQDAQAIVVLAGDVRRSLKPQPHAELGPATLLRCLAAAKVYREAGPLPVVVSGGKGEADSPGLAAAELMRDFLERLGLASSDLIVEPRSTSTYGNAVESAHLLSERGIRKVILVTDATHMHRAMLCFRGQSLEPVAAPCNRRAGDWSGPIYDYVVPSTGALANANVTAHEWLGIVWYWLHGRI